MIVSPFTQPPPQGVWGMPAEMLRTLPGYGPDIAANRAEARELMERAGYGPDKRLAIKVSVRNTPAFRDPAAILIDQLREIFIDGELETVDTVNWFPKVYRKDYKIGLNLTGAGVDDPDAQFYENYACGSDRNYTGYCNPEIDRLFDQQSMERDQEKRRRLVWEIDRRLQEDEARPILFHNRFATCWHPQVRGLARNWPLPRPRIRFHVHWTSVAVKGLPSCHFTPSRIRKVSAVPSAFHDHCVASSGWMPSRRFWA